MWGASFPGKSIGKVLQSYGINISTYWDLRFEELGEVNEVKVVSPFSSDNNQDTLVIICTGNRVIFKSLVRNLIEMVKNSGVCYTVGLFSPECIVLVSLAVKDKTVEAATNRRSTCQSWDQIKNGKVHPCDYANSMYSLHILDAPTDYVDLNQKVSVGEMRRQLTEYRNRLYYEVLLFISSFCIKNY